jgi:hypothetical protein
MQRVPGQPPLSDFSQKAIQRAVLKEGLAHPLTLFPPALGLISGLAGFLFSVPLLFAIMAGTFVIGAGSIIVNIFLLSERSASRYIRRLNAKLKEHEKYVLASLEKDLLECSSIKGGEHYAPQGVEQFRRIQEKYQNVLDLLEQKLSSGELTFGRFSGAAEQVYLSTLNNLKQVVATLQSAGTIDPGYIEGRLEQLAMLKQKSEADGKEVDTLKKRRALREEQLDKVNHLLTRNEEAMTEMETTTAAIADMQTDGSFAATDFDHAITLLQELAQRAHMYNHK